MWSGESPEPFLPCGFETGVVAFALGAQRIDTLEAEALAVNGKAIVIGYGFVLGAAAVLFAVVPIPVIAGTDTGLGLAEGAAELLSGTTSVGCFSVLVHGEASLAEEIAYRQFSRVFGGE